jgi:integrase/recombinase XerD
VRRFQRFTNEYPWLWMPAHADEFFGDLRAERSARQSIIRNYQQALSANLG